MNDEDIPEEIRYHAEGQPGGFLWQAAREGAWRFGYRAVYSDGRRIDTLFPLNWPGAAPEDTTFELSAEWPDGSSRVPGEVLSVDEAREYFQSKETSDEASARHLLGDLSLWLQSPERKSRHDADSIRALLPDDLEEPPPMVLKAFLAGFLFRGMQDSGWIAKMQTELEKRRSRKSNKYLDAARVALILHGHKGALSLLEKIGARQVKDSNPVVWLDAEGREIDVDQWEKAVKSAGQR